MLLIEQHLKDFLQENRASTPKYTKYRSFLIVNTLPNSKHFTRYYHQRQLEKYRPIIDYLLLPTNQLLVGFSSEYKELARAAIELAVSNVVKQQAQVLSAYQHLHNIYLLYQDGTSYADKFPELFI